MDENQTHPNHNISDDKSHHRDTWGTWEDLLLASAVKRHGSSDWNLISKEIQNRTTLPATAKSCHAQFLRLQRRFNAVNSALNTAVNAVDHVVQQLRSLRVAELRQELQRHDVNILALENKVKILEEERERNVNEKPDLEKAGEPGKGEPEERFGPGERFSGDVGSDGNKGRRRDGWSGVNNRGGSDRENKSVNESNSTSSRGRGEGEPGPVRSELRDLGRESGEVQSSVSLTRKRKSRMRRKVEGGDGEAAAEKLGPLVGVLGMIRGHEHGSLFERRIENQDEWEKYKSVVRKHVDLQTIQARITNGYYSSSSGSAATAFFRDLLLLFTNAAAFFPSDSVHSRAAAHLSNLIISNHLKNFPTIITSPSLTPPPPPPSPSSVKPENSSNNLLQKHKASAPILVCRKRSFMTGKPSSASTFKVTSKEKKPPPQKKPPPVSADSDDESTPSLKEKPVTGARSMRKSNKNLAVVIQSKKLQSSNKSSHPKVNQKSKEAANKKVQEEEEKAASLSEKKRIAATDFLKNLKKNSSGGGGGRDQKKVMVGGKGEQKGGKERKVVKNDNQKVEKNNDKNISSRSKGRPLKKVGESNDNSNRNKNSNSNVLGSSKRGRDQSGSAVGGGNSGKDRDKGPKKRTRR